MNSSYINTVDFGEIISTITFAINPKKIVEFGILEGFSLQKFITSSNSDCRIEAYDLFEDFNGNHSREDIFTKFSNYSNVKIEKANMYSKLLEYEDNSIDILHVDIANNGEVYEFIFNNAINKVRKGGLILLEGGSEERDNTEWMIKYNKPKIQPILEKYSNKYNIKTVENFPSITLIRI